MSTIYSGGFKAQDTVGCILSPEECRKVLILKNDRDSYLESLKLSEELLDSTRQEAVLKDSLIKSYVIIERKHSETVEIMDIVNEQNKVHIGKLEKAVRIRNTALRIGIPTSLILGLAGGVYITSRL